MKLIASLIATLLLHGTLLFAAPGDELKDVKEFEQRVQRYWDLRNQIDAATPPIPADDPTPTEIVAREDALDERIRAARADAREGDIFTTEISRTLKAIIRRQLSSKHGAAAREMILGEGNPANSESRVPVDLKVNGEYPTDAPISTTPPSILAVLPRLPDGLEYRFVDRDMFLYDSEAALIVDIMRNAIE
jgi:hypothetical protein